MPDIHSIAAQIKHNCNISDAKYWGFYSPCGLLLRLRGLYSLEKGIQPWQTVSRDKIADWIGKRESLWERLSSLDFRRIEINNKKYHPFDIKGINNILNGEGLFYGAGYGNLMKPAFILAEIAGCSRIGRYSIYILSRELARDLMSSPAMLQGNTIIARNETMKLLLWEKLLEMRARKHEGFLSYAFSEYGIQKADDLTNPEVVESRLEHIARKELETCVHHELGEASQRRLLGTWWKQMVIKLSYSRAELYIRALKDVLSDTCRAGMLEHIITQKKTGSLGFYLALLGGYRKIIFPDIVSAYDDFLMSSNWELIEKARVRGYKKTRTYIKRLKGIADKGDISPETIEEDLIPEIT
jgi:hypothetical protein